jgi:uncharacterized protein HemX
MEMNKVSTSIISVLVTIAIALGTFAYQTGTFRNEVKNLKEDIVNLEDHKAEKVVVAMMITSIKENSAANTEQHTKIMTKLDKLIEGK